MNRVDQGVLESAQMGDVEAFARIVEVYQDQLFTLSFRFLSSAVEAQDAVQETFMRVYVNLPRYNGNYKFSTWIYRIATNVCIDRLRKRRVEQSLDAASDNADDLSGAMHERLASSSLTPEEVLLRGETCNEVQRALADLPTAYQTVLLLRYIQELSLQEISDILHVPVTTVKTRIHRGREAMKALLRRVPVS